jgi:type IV pilus assembly protein PilA
MNRRRAFMTVVVIIAIAFVLTVAAVKVPLSEFERSKRFADEMGAVRAIQKIHQIEVQYQSQYSRYATSLSELGPPANEVVTAKTADLIDGLLASGSKSGYRFTLAGSSGGYTITASPQSFGGSGAKNFYSDQTMVIRYNAGPEPATANSPEVGAVSRPFSGG